MRDKTLKAAAKALGVGFCAYVMGEIVRMLNPGPCTDDVSCSTSGSPNEEHIVIVSVLVFALAFGAFLARAQRRKY
jgi:hypothetical protein